MMQSTVYTSHWNLNNGFQISQLSWSHDPLLSSLTLYSRNQNCNNYFHHVKQKYIKQNISRYFIFASHSPGWLVAGCGGGSGIYQMWGDRLQCSELASTWTCRVLSCHVINYIQSHLFTWHQPSQSASSPAAVLHTMSWCLPSISRYECSYTVMLIQSSKGVPL